VVKVEVATHSPGGGSLYATKARNLHAIQAFFTSSFDISAAKRNTFVSGTPSALVAGIQLKHLKLTFSYH
jgi:hypothetical protein